jgi:creatinine amidohydrolase
VEAFRISTRQLWKEARETLEMAERKNLEREMDSAGSHDHSAPRNGLEPKVLLEEMNWVEAKELLPRVKIGIVPVGSTEQHAPHLPLLVDTACAAAIAKRTAEKIYPSAVVTPTMQVGVSYHHMLFPGSLTISEDTLVNWCYDIASSLKQYNLKLVFFLNGHWGNKTALALTTRKIRCSLDIKSISISYWDLYPAEYRYLVEDGRIPDHAGEFETSLTLALREELVRKDWRRDPQAYTMDPKKHQLFLTADDQFPIFGATKDGITFGNPVKATRVKGEKMIDLISDEVAKFLNDLLSTYI